MENLNRKAAGCPTMPGWSGIWAATDKEVEAVAITGSSSRSVIFKDGGKWGKIIAKSIQISDSESDGARQLTITCTFIGIAADTDRLFIAMAARRWLVRLKDRGGRYWLAGSKEQPLRFSWSHDADAKPKGSHAYTLQWSAVRSEPLYATI